MLPSFYGHHNKEPYKHLDEFLEICSTVKIQDLSENALKLLLFPFSLKDKAKHWLHSLDSAQVTTWAEMQQQFLKKFFPIGWTNTIRRAVTTFSQNSGEEFHEYWERLKELLQKCPHHAIPKWQLVQCFYDGLRDQYHQIVDASYGGTFMHKSETEARDLFETLSENSQHRASASRTEVPTLGQPKKGGLYEINQSGDIKAQVDLLSKKMDYLLSGGPTQPPSISRGFSPPEQAEACALCADPNHYVTNCYLAAQYPEFIQEKENTEKENEQPVGEGPQPDKYTPRVPFPDALKTPSSPPFGKQGEEMKEMLDLFQQVHINLPLLDAIKQVPAYAKFLKDLCTQKRKLRNQTPKTIHLIEQVSAVITDLPPKLKDPGIALISCVIGDLSIDKALLDQGASVNILPGSIFEKFGLGELKSIKVILQLADRSMKRPHGLLEDVLVKVDDLYFLVDFLVLDMESTSAKLPPVILGHPFLATANACINYKSSAMDISFGNKKLRLNIFNASLGPYREDECFALDMIDEVVSQYTSQILTNDPLQLMMSFGAEDFDEEAYTEEVNAMLDLKPSSGKPSSLESPPQLELKPLPHTLKYAFLDKEETLPVIISSELTERQESLLLEVLSTHKAVIG
ncbi:uncharacterized protein LOC122647429 [Telopea speciosissima]|uniref:uncharacterized protein LOC122647429 n=1 Tax=Telopea speciosissima TaxID=54955 RepID=UPI001CC54BE5|nr:uncharacterized protein LOC122647429 [Telopea speciosissima]